MRSSLESPIWPFQQPERADFFNRPASIHEVSRWQVAPKLLEKAKMLLQSPRALQLEFCLSQGRRILVSE